jgi:hypothetical protein
VRFTLNTVRGIQSDSKFVDLTWGARVYYGTAATPGAYDSAFVTSIAAQNSVLTLTRQRTVSFNATAGQRAYYLVPSTYGTPVFFTNGAANGFANVASVNFTNAFGQVITYHVWESVNTGLGSFSTTVA